MEWSTRWEEVKKTVVRGLDFTEEIMHGRVYTDLCSHVRKLGEDVRLSLIMAAREWVARSHPAANVVMWNVGNAAGKCRKF